MTNAKTNSDYENDMFKKWDELEQAVVEFRNGNKSRVQLRRIVNLSRQYNLLCDYYILNGMFK